MRTILVTGAAGFIGCCHVSRALAAQEPLNRFPQPDEIAEVVLFLASDQNTHLTGHNLVVN